jgi:hypothetical protein
MIDWKFAAHTLDLMLRGSLFGLFDYLKLKGRVSALPFPYNHQ